ncbi:hypothetical protein [Shimia sp. MIT910701]|uniref:hypothetical protein n=1 Tax=Shimia sp. MIT910701 TaxID=3096987 RepID=UPI00399B08E8
MDLVETRPDAIVPAELSQRELLFLIESNSEFLLIVDVANLPAVQLPTGSRLNRVLILEDHLILVQTDGTLIVLKNVLDANVLVLLDGTGVPLARLIDVATPQSEWALPDDAPTLPVHFVMNPGASLPGSVQEDPILVNDPLIGLPIVRLLPPTGYIWGGDDQVRYGAASDDTESAPFDVDIVQIAPVVALETDAIVAVRPSLFFDVIFSNPANGSDSATTHFEIHNLPMGTAVSAGVLSAQADGSLSLSFDGSYASFLDLQIFFPPDFSTESRSDISVGSLPATLQVETITGNSQNLSFDVTLLPEGDVTIDDTLPDAVADETDSATLLTPSSLLLPSVTDVDGSESFDSIVLTIRGLPAGIALSQLGITLPSGVTASVGTDTSNGTTTVIFDFSAATTATALDAYRAFALSLPADFSTTNRSDLSDGSVALPIALQLDVQTDEDHFPSVDGPVDGTATAIRNVDIEATPDIDLSAPTLLTVAEDGGVQNISVGVLADLGISIAITDADGSETADTLDPRFAASVTIDFVGLPPGTTASAGILDNGTNRWSGTVAEAEALSLFFPGNYNGSILSTIAVTTPEGTVRTAQAIVVTPTPDIIISGSVYAVETDAPLAIRLSDFIDVLVTDPSETVDELELLVVRLPPGTFAVDGNGNSIGSSAPAGDGTFFLDIVVRPSDGIDPRDVEIILPKDYSSVSPNTQLGSVLLVTTSDGREVGQIPIVIGAEGDLVLTDADLVLTETDAPVRFTPSSSVLPAVNDIDGSESISMVAFDIDNLPTGTRFSTDSGATFVNAGASISFTGTLNQYLDLMIELPRDYSTENPLTDLFAEVSAVTDEGGTGTVRLDITVDFELDVSLTLPPIINTVEDADGVGVSVDLQIQAMATDQDGSEDSATVRISFTDLPSGASVSTGTLNSFLGIWTGTMAEANSLALNIPEDFSGTIDLDVTILSPEGSLQKSQTIVIAPAGDIVFDISAANYVETDAYVTVTPSDHWNALIADSDGALPVETLATLTLTLTGLPPGVLTSSVPVSTISYDPTAGGAFQFTGTEAQYAALTLQFPPDFSTVSPSADGLTIDGTLAATSSEDATGQSASVSLTIAAEGDVQIDDSLPDTVADETDAPTLLVPSQLLLPQVTDLDGSESLEEIELTIEGLPAGITLAALGITLPAGATSTITTDAANGSETLVISLNAAAVADVAAAYQALSLSLPTDFSTTNRSDLTNGDVSLPLKLSLFVQTDEDFSAALDTPTDGTALATRLVEIDYELDVALSAPPLLQANEDRDGAGVSLDLGISVAATDIDGSEDSTTVEIVFTGLPTSAGVSEGTLDAATGIWRGTMAEANALELQLPQDYSGTITSETRAFSPEGTTSTTQTIEIAPTGDIALTIAELVAAETDATVLVTPSASWIVSISDSDGTLPQETINTVTLTLQDLPPAVVASGVPAATVTYDASLGGQLVFVGTEAQYLALRLSFPTDYSTESPSADGTVISGTLAATSTEDATGVSQAVTLRITPEGDVEIDDSLPDTVADETDAVTPVRPSDLLLPKVTDLDSSEKIENLVLIIDGLPAGSSLASLNITVPTGGSASFSTSATNGSSTLTLTLNTAGVTDVLAAYQAFSLELPADFSTANRSDLTDGTTALVLRLELRVQTDEDQNVLDDTLIDGTATAERFVDIDFEADIDLQAPDQLMVQEDNGSTSTPSPVDIDLQLDITIDDADGSETADPSDPRFAATVKVTFLNLPAGATTNGGTLNSGVWTGTVAEANALVLTVPENYNGIIKSIIEVTTPEGFATKGQVIEVTPVPDVVVTGFIAVQETDSKLSVALQDFIDVVVGAGETVLDLTFDLDGLPIGTVVQDAGGNTIGTLTPSGSGTIDFFYEFDGSTPFPTDPTIILPQDYSTTSPLVDLNADMSVTTGDGTVAVTVPFFVLFEGDITTPDANLDIAETDAPVVFSPFDHVVPTATDIDGSEAVVQVTVLSSTMPPGARVSTDNGLTFSNITGAFLFSGTMAEYMNLAVELPADFSTENPPSSLSLEILGLTNELGVDVGVLSISLSSEGDLSVTNTGPLVLTENDAVGDVDEDTTTDVPQTFQLSSIIAGTASDADGSESISKVDVSITGLPSGARYSTDGGLAYAMVPGGATFILNGLNPPEYTGLIFEVPADFATTTDITGSVTFFTDEAKVLVDTGPNDGVATETFSVTIETERDVAITAQDITVIEDLGVTIPLNLDVDVTDTDGSENLTSVGVDFSDLPVGNTTLTDGTILNGPTATWSGSLAQLQALGIASLPEHFSGIVQVTVNAITDEGGATPTTEDFDINVTPVAEPTIALSVDASPSSVEQTSADNFIVKEDTTFLLTILAQTPDRDGSEQLTQVTIDNVPPGWLRAGDGAINLALFEAGASEVASASIAGSVLTITLNADVQVFDAALRVSPTADDDRDVATLTGDDFVATVTSVDAATGLASDTKTASDGVDVDVDAVADGLSYDTDDKRTSEKTDGAKNLNIGLSNLVLDDSDGSEVLNALSLTITVATESDGYDPSNSAHLLLLISNNALSKLVDVTQTGSTANSVDYDIEPLPGTTAAEFAEALEHLRITVPQHFSGILTLDGTLSWSETTTGDIETDPSDNPATSVFQIVEEVRPVVEAALSARVFVNSSTEVESGSPTAVAASVLNGAVAGSDILTLLESTADGTGPGQVDLFVSINASTPDLDGSEEVQTITIANTPTDWIADHLSGTTVLRSAFFASNGTNPISDAEYAKISSAQFDSATGIITIALNADVTSFDAALQLRPSLYEDYDVDRIAGDPFASVGDFFGDDLVISITVEDDNTNETRQENSEAKFDVDVAPVNNTALIATLPGGNEQVIDDAGGVWQIPIDPQIQDTDGSETVTAVLIRKVPAGLTVYVTDPSDPTGPKIPALLNEVDTPPGFNSWSLENGEWTSAELQGIPTHFAGNFPVEFVIVTTEADGNQTSTTTLDVVLFVDPVIDGGNPNESASGFEDTAIQVSIDGNIIDNLSNSPESPEAFLDVVLVTNVQPDSFGRLPTFFDGPPAAHPIVPKGFINVIHLAPDGSLKLTPAQAENLWLIPGQDSNETIEFDLSVIYYETIDPTQVTLATGKVTVDVVGIADDPFVSVQDPDPTNDPGTSLTDGDINAIFRPTEIVDGVANADRVFAYAGFDTAPFELDQRVRELVLKSGFIFTAGIFKSADPMEGVMTEITKSGNFDGSETLYYVITGVDPATSFLGASPVDGTGESYVVTEAQLATLEFVPADVSEVTYYDMKLNAIVVEDDQPIGGLIGTPEEILAQIDGFPGGSVTTLDFSVMVLPDTGGGGGSCTPEQDLPLPILALVGSGDEDTTIELKVQITAAPPFYSDLNDLISLPNGVSGNFGIGIHLPPGASLSSDPPGAILFDPITGLWVIDLAKLGVDGSDPTLSAGSILFTPPDHESSPKNPFPTDETFGADDPYDGLNSLSYETLLYNFTCGSTTSGSGSFSLTINPVVDGPTITLPSSKSFDEDTNYALDIGITSPDGGERPFGDVFVDLDTSVGASLLDGGGTPLTGVDQGDGTTRYTLTYDQLTGLQLVPPTHFSGTLQVVVTAASQDIDNSTKSTKVTANLEVIPVADDPTFTVDTSVIDPETGLPFVDQSGGTPRITAIEDVPFNLASVITADSPDQDGSETVTIVLSGVPSYLNVIGPSNGGFINNGDGSYTISEAAFPQVSLVLLDQHARTPDSLDPSLPSQIPLTLTVNTLELANSDQATGSQDFLFRVRQDADTPSVTASATPTTGIEDSGSPFALTISGETPDPHETVSFEITAPTGARLFVGGSEITASGGVFSIPGTAVVSGTPSINYVFEPTGVVTFLPPEHFAGMVDIEVTAISSDADGIFPDTERSTPADVALDITVSPDLVVTELMPAIDLDETDLAVEFVPSTGFDIDVLDTDSSEFVDNVDYTITGVPAGTQYRIGTGTPVDASTDLTFIGSLADFQQMTVILPRDFATNGTPLAGTLTVTTNEGGSDTSNFTVAVSGELDLDLLVDVQPASEVQTGAPLVVDFGIDATVTDVQAIQSETLEKVTVAFSSAPPVGTVPSAGTLTGSQLVLTRGATSPTDFALLVAALSITLPVSFSGVLSGDITVETNHGVAPAEAFSVSINDLPVVSGPVDLASTDTTLSTTFTELLTNASDATPPLTVENIVANEPFAVVSVVGTNVEVSVPNAFVGTVQLTYDVVDSGAGPGRTSATANLDFDTLQMVANGTDTGPDGVTRDLMDDVTGTTLGGEIAKGTSGDDAVILNGTRPYLAIDGFDLMGGTDFVDLSASSSSFDVVLGAGNDIAIGGAGNDTLSGGAGVDTLTGGSGQDVFVVTDLSTTDQVLDFEAPTGAIVKTAVDQVDLTAVVALSAGESLADFVGYNNANGQLSVSGNNAMTIESSAGVFSNEIEVIFTNAAGAQETAII